MLIKCDCWRETWRQGLGRFELAAWYCRRWSSTQSVRSSLWFWQQTTTVKESVAHCRDQVLHLLQPTVCLRCLMVWKLFWNIENYHFNITPTRSPDAESPSARVVSLRTATELPDTWEVYNMWLSPQKGGSVGELSGNWARVNDSSIHSANLYWSPTELMLTLSLFRLTWVQTTGEESLAVACRPS